MTNEQTLTDFMQRHYTDERLVHLLAWAEDGGLSFQTCCCFVGVATADHALRTSVEWLNSWGGTEHLMRATELSGANEAEDAFMRLGETNAERREKIIPLIRAEIARRETATQCIPSYEADFQLAQGEKS